MTRTTTPPPPPPSSSGELVNIKVGRSENRQLVTGSHVVADISCRVCGTKVGWKYVDARESAQRYKIGKFILETARVVAWRGWGQDRPGFDDRDDDDEDAALGSDVDYDDDEADRLDDDDDDRAGWPAADDVSPPHKDGGAVENDDEGDGPVVFDSDDEDECEDIFAGTWNADAVAKRRKMRRSLVGRRV
jgi:hypothetical protein